MKYGLIGEKLSHSFSKPIHESMGEYVYEIKEIARGELDSFMKARDFTAINVTIPYKQAVMPYLDYIDPVAEKIGAVNTIVNREGKLSGYNTDFGGLKMLVEKSGFDYEGRKVLIAGTGGTSKTAKCVAEALGAKEIIIVGRSETADVKYENVYSLHSDADYIINTTPLGMYPDFEGCCLDVTAFRNLKGVTDAVYNPLKTRLCLNARQQGIECQCGLYMLVCQAVIAYGIFTDKKTDVKAIADRIYKDLLLSKQNIVLVGMPGCGKTTIGKELSEKLGKSFVDTDELITREHGDIPSIFENKGEEYFRDLEATAVKKVSKENGLVIATGGGAVLRKENVDYLRHNGKIFFLDRPLEDIIPTEDRPLSRDADALKKRFEERYGIYCEVCDGKIAVDGIVENSVNKIMGYLK